MRTSNLATSYVALALSALLLSRCQAVVVKDPEDHSILPTSAERFIFWENCEDRLNEEKGVTERCCAGNYRCSSDICKGKSVCRLRFMPNFLWCHNRKCTPKDPQAEGELDNVDNDDGENRGEDDNSEEEAEESAEPSPTAEEETPEPDTPSEEVTSEPNPPAEEEEPPSSPTPSPSASPSSSPAVSPSPSPAPAADEDPLNCIGRRDRREIRDMTPNQRREWQQAIIALRADRDENGNSEWDRLVQTHMNGVDEAHGGSYFLPWHRLFLLRFENALRKKQPGLALPYWDWSRDASNAALSRIWNPGFVGGAREGNRPIQNGPFQNMDGTQPVGHIVRRDFTSGNPGAIPLLWSTSSLERLLDVGSWADFSDGVEAAHALPHIYIGGDMSNSHYAPNDPVFYLHHAFIDRLYAMRQQRRGNNEFGGTHDFLSGSEAARPGRRLEVFGVPASRAFNLECVSYVAPSDTVESLDGRGVDRVPENPCNKPAITGGDTISPERCAHGTTVLTT